MKRLTLKQAFRYALQAWQYRTDHDGDPTGLNAQYPEIMNLQARCGLCEYSLRQENRGQIKYICQECPLAPIDVKETDFMVDICCEGLYYKYIQSHTKENAQTVLSLSRQNMMNTLKLLNYGKV